MVPHTVMTFLSLFTTTTGVFCFIPISHRLLESGIIPTSNHWRFRKLPSARTRAFRVQHEEEDKFLHAIEKYGDTWSDIQIPRCSTEGALAVDRQLAVPYVNNGGFTGAASLVESSSMGSLLHSISFDTFYGRDSASVISDTTLCDNCNTLLRYEIPPDHIPSVIRAFELFEAQDRSPDVGPSECDVVSLANAFSMLRL